MEQKSQELIRISEVLNVNQEYEYEEICNVLNERVKTGGAKNSQFNNWKKYFEWIKPNRRKFLITNIINDNYMTNKVGGAREGSGRKSILNDEFEYILNCFAKEAKRHNGYYRKLSDWGIIYFTNDIFSKVFGLYSDFYAGKYDEHIDKDIYHTIYKKLEARRRLLYSKIIKLFNEETLEHGKTREEFGYGIIAFKNAEKTRFDYRDDLHPQWKEYQAEYISVKKLGYIGNIIEQDLWDDMLIYISSKFDGYHLVKEYTKIRFDLSRANNYSKAKYDQYRKTINETVVKSIYDKCLKKEIREYDEDKEQAEFEMECAKEMYDFLMDVGIFPVDTAPLGEFDCYKEWDKIINSEFNEEETMKPYVYILDNYVRI